jgi:twitching motility protein PilU
MRRGANRLGAGAAVRRGGERRGQVKLNPYLRLMVDQGGSDMFFSVGARPEVKVEGKTLPVGKERLTGDDLSAFVEHALDEEQREQFATGLELNSSLSVSGIGRFRLYVFRQRGEVAMVVRHVKHSIPSIQELSLPSMLEKLVMEKRGLVLVVGATGSGKSTTLASMLDFRNQHGTGHILTIEDPIEFIHPHKRCVVDQREVGIDTLSFAEALKNALRGAPDLIMIGEVRDAETMQHAVRFAETGHLCLATLHATNARQAIERAANFFPEDSKNRLLQDLSLNLRAVIAQRLVPGVAGKRVAAVEIMRNTPHISELIEKGRITEIQAILAKHTEKGVVTFDQSVFELWKAGRISPREAVRYADSQHEVRMRIEFEKPGTFSNVDPDDLTIQDG